MKKIKHLLLTLVAMTIMTQHALAEKTIVRKFDNGLLWVHRPVKHNQIAALRLLFPCGQTVENAAQAGITRLMGAVLFKGTDSRSALRIAQEAEQLGASLDASSEDDFWSMSLQVPADRFKESLALFSDVLFHPAFPEEEVRKERDAHLNAIRAKHEHIFNVAYERFQKEMFGAHPYARPDDGAVETVAALNAGDLRAWHQKITGPSGAVLVTVGNIPSGTLATLVKENFGAWTAAKTPPPLPGRAAAPAAAVTAEETHPFEQSYLMLAWPAPSINDPEYAALKVLNALLGSGMSSPLFKVIREEGNLAYEVSSFYPSRLLGSAFVIYVGMDPANLDKAQGKAMGLVADFLAKPLAAEDLTAAKRYIKGHYLMDHQTNGRLAWYLGWWEILNKGHAYDKVYPAKVDAVTADDVKRAAKRIFNHPPVIVRILSKK